MRSGRRQAAEQEVERRFCRARRASGGKNGDPMTDLSRRRLLAAGASAAASAAAVAGLSSCSGGDDASRSAKTAEAAASSPTAAPKNPAQWLIDENASMRFTLVCTTAITAPPTSVSTAISHSAGR